MADTSISDQLGTEQSRLFDVKGILSGAMARIDPAVGGEVDDLDRVADTYRMIRVAVSMIEGVTENLDRISMGIQPLDSQ